MLGRVASGTNTSTWAAKLSRTGTTRFPFISATVRLERAKKLLLEPFPSSVNLFKSFTSSNPMNTVISVESAIDQVVEGPRWFSLVLSWRTVVVFSDSTCELWSCSSVKSKLEALTVSSKARISWSVLRSNTNVTRKGSVVSLVKFLTGLTSAVSSVMAITSRPCIMRPT